MESEAESLVSRALGGDEEAFGKLYDMYVDNIYRHIFYRISNKSDAQDLTQEVFIKAWKALPKYKATKTPFLGWLFTITHNRVIDYYRTHKDYDNIENETITTEKHDSPECFVETRAMQQEVRRAIQQLPDDQQKVIFMSFIEGFEYSEIAQTLQKSEGNVRVIIHRGLKRLHDILGDANG